VLLTIFAINLPINNISMEPCRVFGLGGHGKCKQISKCKNSNPILIFLQPNIFISDLQFYEKKIDWAQESGQELLQACRWDVASR
jgi:hypothetical protein